MKNKRTTKRVLVTDEFWVAYTGSIVLPFSARNTRKATWDFLRSDQYLGEPTASLRSLRSRRFNVVRAYGCYLGKEAP